MPSYRLSKSKLMSFRQCPKRLYLEVHQPELRGVDDEAERIMQIGTDVGEVARSVFGHGTLVGHDQGMAAAVAFTAASLSSKDPSRLYEATFQHKDVLVRTDVLEPVRGGVALTEVKSSTSVKEHYVDDCAIQAHVVAGSGLNVRSVHLAHIDNQFVYPGDQDYDGLFLKQDLTSKALALDGAVKKWVRAAGKIIDGTVPEIEIGPHCSIPNGCPFLEHCAPPDTEYPLSILPRMGLGLMDALRAEGYEDVRKIPAGRLTNATHERVRRITKSGKAEWDRSGIGALRALGYPRFYLDFETITFAVPIWKGTRPYQQLPFQWSCHIETRDGSLAHKAFLDISGEAPMRACIEQLLQVLSTRGAILVYSHFEKTCLTAAATMFPDLAERISAVIERLVDLLPYVRESYYHPEMKGSWSIKPVLKAIAPELRYDTLGEVRDGGGAQAAFLELIEPKTAPERRDSLRSDLLNYCERDTLAMVEVYRALVA